MARRFDPKSAVVFADGQDLTCDIIRQRQSPETCRHAKQGPFVIHLLNPQSGISNLALSHGLAYRGFAEAISCPACARPAPASGAPDQQRVLLTVWWGNASRLQGYRFRLGGISEHGEKPATVLQDPETS